MAELAGLHVKLTGDANDLVAAANRAAAAAGKVGKAVKKTQTAAQKTAKANKTLAKSLEGVKRKIAPVLTSTERYANIKAVLNKSYAAGLISEKQMNLQLQKAATQFKVTGSAAQVFGAQIKTSRFHTANLGAQFNDIGVMLAAGQSPLMLAVQQGTQITQVLNTMGGTGRQQLKALGESFLTIVNPTALLTIGIIAGGAALIQWGIRAFGAAEGASALKDAEEKLNAISSSVSGALDILTMDTHELAVQFGEGAKQARLFAYDIAKLGEVKLEAALRDKLRTMSSAIGGYLRPLSLEMDRAITTSAAHLGAEARDRFVNAVHPIASELASGTQELDAQQESITALMTTYEKFDADLKNLPVSLTDAMNAMREFGIEHIKTQQLLKAALEAPKAPPPPGTGDGGSGSGGSEADRFAERMAEEEAREAERLKIEIDRILAENDTKLEIERQFHAQRLQILTEALEAGLITEQEFARLSEENNKDHNDRLAEIDRAVNATRLGGAADFFGAMANAFAQGNEKMLRISKVFGAAQALINAWRAFADVLATAEPWYIKIPAALGVLAAGLNAVNAIKGVGKGGSGKTTTAAATAGQSSTGQTVAQQETSNTTAVNISLRGQNFDRGAVIGLIEQINEAVGDGARIRAS